MPDSPLVSVLTASYNMGHYLREAVDSVLAQGWPTLEVIIIDDGSTDDTPRVCETWRDEPRVRIIRQTNQGQTAAKNTGLKAACGEFVGFCDADDSWLPQKLRRQVPVLRSRPEVAVVYGDTALVDARGEPLPDIPVQRFSGRITGPLLANNFVTFNTVLVRRKVLEEFGGFDESMRMAIDYDLWLRISTRHEFVYLRETLARYRIWGGQMSRRTGERFEAYFRMLERFLERYPGSVTPAEVKRAYAYTYTTRAVWRARAGDRAAAWADLRLALRTRPVELRAWKMAARLLLHRTRPAWEKT